MSPGLFAAAVGIGAASLTVTWFVRRMAVGRRLLDHPNERSAHVRPTPRLGGIGIMASFLPAAFLVATWPPASSVTFVALGATTLVAAIGLWDDLSPLRARTRLGIQVLAASVVTWVAWDRLPSAWSLFGPLVPHWILGLLTVLWIVWLANLYNFMDGIDGLAAGQAVIAATAVAVVTGGAAPTLALLATFLAAGSAGFLVLNFPPASIFMGDVGSTAIGFTFAALPLVAPAGTLPLEVVALALSLFVLDATVTLVRRLSRRERLFEAHRTHFYQRPLALGFGHRTITLAAYAGMVCVAVLAVAYPGLGVAGRLSAIAGAVAAFGICAGTVSHLERERAASRTRNGGV